MQKNILLTAALLVLAALLAGCAQDPNEAVGGGDRGEASSDDCPMGTTGFGGADESTGTGAGTGMGGASNCPTGSGGTSSTGDSDAGLGVDSTSSGEASI